MLRRVFALVIPALVAAAPTEGEGAKVFTAVKSERAVELKAPDGQPILRYVTGALPEGETAPAVESSCYFHPIRTPSGEVVTDLAPEDHRHHRGVFLAWVQMEGPRRADFWGWGAKAPKDGRRIVNRELHLENGTAEGIGFRATNAWLAEGEEIVSERLTVRVSRQGPANVIDLEYALTAPKGDVRIEANPFGGFCYRARPRGTLEVVSPEGKVMLPNSVFDRTETNWPPARWYDFTYRSEGGRVTGVAVIDHPANPRSTWHGHRGIHMLNPCVVADGPVTIGKDRPLVLRYRLVAHDGDAAAAGLPAMAAAFAGRNERS